MGKKTDIFEELNKISKEKKRLWELGMMRIAPEKFVEHKLKQFEKYTESQVTYANLVETYLISARNNIIDQIEKSLTQNLKRNLKLDNLSRIVSSRFAHDPLNSIGSIKRPPGGRFNFGQTTTFSSNYFQALYLAEDYDTAFEETYHSTQDSNISNFLHSKVECFLEDYLDLRDDKVFSEFFRVIDSIRIPKQFDIIANQFNVDPIILCPSAEVLKQHIFSPLFKAWDTYLNQFSLSQWFGFYCYQARIPGMIYPSVRHDGKFNIVIFYDNFENTNSYVGLSKPKDFPFINDTRKLVDKNNFNDLMKEQTQ